MAGEETREFWTLDIAAAVEKCVPMVPRLIRRFQEVAQQRLKDRQETLDLGGTDEDSDASVSSAVDAPDADNPGHDQAAEVVDVVNHNQAGSAKDSKPTPCCHLM